MDYLDEISVEELQNALDNVKRNKPTQRLLAAVAYKDGVTQTELAEWHDTGRRTIYSWLMRFDTDEPLEQAVSDAYRTGRKRKLSETHQKEFERTVHQPPEKSGSTRQRGRRRSSGSFWKKPMASSTPVRVAGDC